MLAHWFNTFFCSRWEKALEKKKYLVPELEGNRQIDKIDIGNIIIAIIIIIIIIIIIEKLPQISLTERFLDSLSSFVCWHRCGVWGSFSFGRMALV